jgi:hypothetical protein
MLSNNYSSAILLKHNFDGGTFAHSLADSLAIAFLYHRPIKSNGTVGEKATPLARKLADFGQFE